MGSFRMPHTLDFEAVQEQGQGQSTRIQRMSVEFRHAYPETISLVRGVLIRGAKSCQFQLGARHLGLLPRSVTLQGVRLRSGIGRAFLLQAQAAPKGQTHMSSKEDVRHLGFPWQEFLLSADEHLEVLLNQQSAWWHPTPQIEKSKRPLRNRGFTHTHTPKGKTASIMIRDGVFGR